MVKSRKLSVLSTEISVVTGINNDDFICLTDMVKASDDESRAADIIKNWIRNRATIEFLGAWEMMYNPNFKVVKFDHFKIRIINLFPCSQIFQCIPISQPVLYYV